MTIDAATSRPVTEADATAIRATVDDYYLGWYDADGERMARALHPSLAKRGWRRGPDGAMVVTFATFEGMVDAAGAGEGRQTDPAVRAYDVSIDVVDGDIASATVHAVPYVDYLHLIRTDDGWRIVNALWRPG